MDKQHPLDETEQNKELMKYRGYFDRAIYFNPINKYCVLSIRTDDPAVPAECRSSYTYRDHLIRFTVTGYDLPRTNAIEILWEGEWHSSKYGPQLQILRWEEIVPQTAEGIKGYSGAYTPDVVLPVQLAVGLPPAHYGAQYERFERYFTGRGTVSFAFNGRQFSILITDALCFPQAYAAACTQLQRLWDESRAVVVDIGGFTADYLQVKFGEAQLSACDSLENGVIHLYNQILSKVNAEFDLRLEESDIDAILERKGGFEPVIADLVERQAASFVGDLFGTLRERGLDLRTGLTIFTGGGAILLRRFIENTGKVGRSLFVTDINANARGFEQLYQSTAQGA